MGKWLQVVVLVAASALVLFAIASWVGQRRWRTASGAMAARLDSAPPSAGSTPSFPGGSAALPAPVARYLAYALPAGHTAIRAARLVQEGEFFFRPGGPGSRFTAVDRVTTDPPGLMWDANIAMAPFVGAWVRDSYLEGVGTMHAALLGLVPLAHETGSPEIATAALQRYLAEAPWVPTALLPSAALAWTGISDSVARATLTDRGIHASVDFHFGPAGEITGTVAERYRTVSGKQVLTPWVGTFSQYERVAGMMVPRRGEISWQLPEGVFTYWRGRLVSAAYEPFP
jgi:hypothetical protein